MSTEKLIEAVYAWVKKLADTGGKAWSLQVPVNLEKDPDVLICEATMRLKKANDILLKLSNLTGPDAWKGKLDEVVKEACEFTGVEHKEASQSWHE